MHTQKSVRLKLLVSILSLGMALSSTLALGQNSTPPSNESMIDTPPPPIPTAPEFAKIIPAPSNPSIESGSASGLVAAMIAAIGGCSAITIVGGIIIVAACGSYNSHRLEQARKRLNAIPQV